MKILHQRKMVRVLFDEFHSESWTVSRRRAAEIQPESPEGSSYHKAAEALSCRDFRITRNLAHLLLAEALFHTDILVIAHPCDPKWEPTTSSNSPRLSSEEIDAIHTFVQKGGGLLVISEYEHEKYGNNLNELLEKFGMGFQNTTVSDPGLCYRENPTWIFGKAVHQHMPLAHLVEQACFYRSASCRVVNGAEVIFQSSDSSRPKNAPLIAAETYGAGKVCIVADSSIFGDKHLCELDHLQLWLNIMYWCSAPAFGRQQFRLKPSSFERSQAWISLKSQVQELRLLQNSDGSVEPVNHERTKELVHGIMDRLGKLSTSFEHQLDYLEQVSRDLKAWVETGFKKPNFARSLALFNPQLNRRDNLEYLILFPMYTPNNSRDTRFETLIIRVHWPEWLAELEKTRYRNEKFVPGQFVDFTDGYASECAVLFPETVSVIEKASNNFGVIFCDRESRRLFSCFQKAAPAVQLDIPPQVQCLFSSPALLQDAVALWDLIHDKSHSMGELPFDPFMIRQRAPFWMYGLEELRVDLRSFCEAIKLAEKDFPFARNVTYAILFDRIFRFPITGNRIRNYDALGGQLLFSFLHQKDVLIWSDNKLTIRWKELPAAVAELRNEIVTLYKNGADSSKMNFWVAAHDLVSQYIRPNVGSRWRKDVRSFVDESDLKQHIDLVLDDEFPLGNFHLNLQKKVMKTF